MSSRFGQLALFPQTSVSRTDNSLRPVDDLQLVEDIGHMVAYRLCTEYTTALKGVEIQTTREPVCGRLELAMSFLSLPTFFSLVAY